MSEYKLTTEELRVAMKGLQQIFSAVHEPRFVQHLAQVAAEYDKKRAILVSLGIENDSALRILHLIAVNQQARIENYFEEDFNLVLKVFQTATKK